MDYQHLLYYNHYTVVLLVHLHALFLSVFLSVLLSVHRYLFFMYMAIGYIIHNDSLLFRRNEPSPPPPTRYKNMRSGEYEIGIRN